MKRGLFMVAALAPALALAELSVAHRRLDAGDGTPLAVYRYLDREPRLRVLLLPEPGFPRACFDPDGTEEPGSAGRRGEAQRSPAQGLAPYLAARGFEVYVLEWRGTGRSGGRMSLAGFERDLRAAVRLAAGGGKVAIVGWGLAGTLAASLEGSGLPVRAVAALGSPFDAPTGEGALGRALEKGGALDFDDPPRGVDVKLLLTHGNAIAEGALAACLDHARWSASYAAELRARLAAWPRPKLPEPLAFPLLAVIAPRDNLWESEQTFALHDAAHGVQLRVAGRADGDGEEYSHLGLVAADAAPGDLFGFLAAWLRDAGGAL